MASLNKFSGFCVTCLKQVAAGHGALTKSASGAWVVQCGAQTNGRVTVARTKQTYGRTAATKRGTRTGCSCGSVEEYTKSSDCFSCKHDAE